jgi:hypothetical protein
MAVFNESAAATERAFEFDVNGTDVLGIDGRGAIVDNRNINRAVFHGAPITIADAAPANLFSVTVPASSVAGGSLFFLIEARDATNTQAISGIATYSSVATSAGTVTGTITYVSANQAATLSSGTLTLSFTASVSGSVCTFRVQPTGSLTETVYNIRFTVLPILGRVTVA